MKLGTLSSWKKAVCNAASQQRRCRCGSANPDLRIANMRADSACQNPQRCIDRKHPSRTVAEKISRKQNPDFLVHNFFVCRATFYQRDIDFEGSQGSFTHLKRSLSLEDFTNFLAEVLRTPSLTNAAVIAAARATDITLLHSGKLNCSHIRQVDFKHMQPS